MYPANKLSPKGKVHFNLCLLLLSEVSIFSPCFIHTSNSSSYFLPALGLDNADLEIFDELEC